MKQDKLINHRSVVKRDNKIFSHWLSTNCSKAKPIEEVRKLTRDIKPSIGKAIKDE
jgi:hypothetical protein